MDVNGGYSGLYINIYIYMLHSAREDPLPPLQLQVAWSLPQCWVPTNGPHRQNGRPGDG